MFISYRFWLCIIAIIVETSSKKRKDRSKTSWKDSVIIGVHFGRDYLRYALFESGNLNIIPNREGNYKTPILINFDEYGNIFCGDSAKLNPNPYNTIYNLPNIIGKRFKEIKEMPDFPFKYNIIDKYNKPYFKITFQNGSLEMTVEEALSCLFRDIKKNSDSFVNDKVDNIVLSIADSTTDVEELAVKAAANKGGLNVLKTIRDSTAAIYGYELNEIEDKSILTVNIGRDSMDIVLSAIETNNIEVVAKKYFPNIGESLFDKVLEDLMIRHYTEKMGKPLDKSFMITELRNRLRELRINLNIFYEFKFYWNQVDPEMTSIYRLSRAKFDELLFQPIAKILDIITKFLGDAEIKRSDISQVILIGSIFNIPKLQNEIRNYFYGLELRIEKNLEEILVEGTAIIAFNMKEITARNNIVYLETVISSLGIEVYNGLFQEIVPQQSVIPIKMSKTFTLSFNDQNKVSIKVLEGHKVFSRGNAFLGEVTFHNVTKGLRGFVLFNIEFDVRRNGIILFTATDIGLGISKSLYIEMDFDKYVDQGSGNEMLDERSLNREEKNKVLFRLRKEIEPIAYEIKSHITLKKAILEKVKSPIDLLILERSADEVILWYESRTISEVEEIEKLKSTFESTVKPILARAYGE